MSKYRLTRAITLLLLVTFASIPLRVSAHGMTKPEAQATLESLGIEESARAFCSAVIEDNLAVVKLFDYLGTDLNMDCELGKTPIYLAVNLQNDKVYEYLKGRRVDVSVPIYQGWTPLLRAISHERLDMAYDLLLRGASARQSGEDSALSYAFLGCDPVLAKKLLENGASVDERWYRGITPLHAAAGSNCTPYIQILLDAGADIDAEDPVGNTPLFYALSGRPRLDAIRLLLDEGSDPLHENKEGQSPLSLVAQKDDPLVQVLFNAYIEGETFEVGD